MCQFLWGNDLSCLCRPVLGLVCKVSGEERSMSTSFIEEALEVEFNQVEVVFTVKLSCMLKQ